MSLKSERLEMRLTAEHKQLLERAAALSGQPLSSFALSLLLERAREIMHQFEMTRLSVADQSTFLALLDADDEPTPALRAAAKSVKRNRG